MNVHDIVCIPSTDSVDALVVVVKQAVSNTEDDDQVDHYCQEDEGRLDDPVEPDEDCRADDCHQH